MSLPFRNSRPRLAGLALPSSTLNATGVFVDARRRRRLLGRLVLFSAGLSLPFPVASLVYARRRDRSADAISPDDEADQSACERARARAFSSSSSSSSRFLLLPLPLSSEPAR